MIKHKYDEYFAERKQNKILSAVCKECGRYKKIPIYFCNECWKEMNETINKKE